MSIHFENKNKHKEKKQTNKKEILAIQERVFFYQKRGNLQINKKMNNPIGKGEGT